MEINRAKLSPMMQKYFETKDQYPGCILFYRLGDFYEMFFDDAITASKELEITLTGKRSFGKKRLSCRYCRADGRSEACKGSCKA